MFGPTAVAGHVSMPRDVVPDFSFVEKENYTCRVRLASDDLLLLQTDNCTCNSIGYVHASLRGSAVLYQIRVVNGVVAVKGIEMRYACLALLLCRYQYVIAVVFSFFISERWTED